MSGAKELRVRHKRVQASLRVFPNDEFISHLAEVAAADIAYLEKHRVRELLAEVTGALVSSKPRDPVQVSS